MPNARFHHAFLTLFFTLLCSSASLAQQPVVSVELKPDTCTIGDDIVCTLTVLKKPTLVLNYPQLNDTASFTPFEIRRIEKSPMEQRDTDNTLVTEKMRYTLTVFDTGMQRLPLLAIAYLDEQTKKHDTLVVPSAQRIYVMSVLDTSRKDIADIKPIQTLPIPLWIWLAGAVALILLCVAAYFIYAALKKRGKKIAAPNIVVVKSPYETAIEKLQALESVPLMSQADFKKYYSDLSDTVREFLEQHYGFPAMEQLTSEIYETLLRRRPREEAMRARQLLDKADLVKFAKFYPSALEAKESLQLAYGIVEVAKPISTEPLTSVKG